MNKNAIKKFAIEARKKLIDSVTDKAGMLGITEKSCSEPVTKGVDFEVYQTIAGTEVTLNKRQCEQRRRLVAQMKARGFESVVEEVAYTWFNRICAIRFMEVNDYLPNRVRVLSSEKEGKMEPDIVTQALDVDLDLTEQEKEEIINWKLSGTAEDTDKLYCKLFLKQCHQLHEILPGLFEADSDYMELLFATSYTNKDDVIYMLVNPETGIPEDDFNVSALDEEGNPIGQVEIIGWLYQYYNTELKDDTFAKLKKKVKITKERIPAATQLFTPDWIVRYMVENSVGRIWIEHLRALDPSTDEKATAERFGWKYYLPEAEQEESVNAKLAEIRTTYKDLKPTDITCIDPCMGSGHILIAMFDVLMDIYESAGYDKREAAFEIVEHNIHGLDIDQRAYQLAYFAVMMKGRGYNRRFLRERDGKLKPKVYAIAESNEINRNHLKFFGTHLSEMERNLAVMQIEGLLDTFVDAREYGSILSVDACDWNVMERFIEDLGTTGQISFESVGSEETQKSLQKLVRVAKNLGQKYDAVVTNPPYMGGSNMSSKLSVFLKDKYNDSKLDFSAVFVEKCRLLTKNQYFCSLVIPQSIFFLTAYKEMRRRIFGYTDVISMLHLGTGAFDNGFGTVALVMQMGNMLNQNGIFYDLREGKTSITKQTMFWNKENVYVNNMRNINKMPNCVMAYWCPDSIAEAFSKYPQIRDEFALECGIKNGNNSKFLRAWFEVSDEKINFSNERKQCLKNMECGKKWFKCNKGGGYKKWYGNYEYVVDLEHNASNIRTTISPSTYRLRKQENYFWPTITWPLSGGNKFGCRYMQIDTLPDVNANIIILSSVKEYCLMGYMNSIVFETVLDMLNPTVNFPIDTIGSAPYIEVDDEDIKECVEQNIKIAKQDWDSFECSWDYQSHPLIRQTDTIKKAYDLWKDECDWRFDKLKKNEEKLNSFFIDLYEVKKELVSTVDDKDITVQRANLEREIRSLISYAVGCMFGRYSLDEKGLIYAGGKWDIHRYNKYMPDTDNCIPITDEEYFTDDIVTRFSEFIKIVYGENKLEENLEFIAKVLGNKGNSSRDIIRNYFLNDFFKDHCSIYSVTGSGKCPIYWLFDCGKQNGFKALIYMHRYDADTVGRVRTDYLHRAQKYVETAMQSAQYTIDNASSASEKSKATKAVTKYTKQLAEMKIYDEAIAHIANKRIEIDLDDGVKANYTKFQGVEVAQEGKKTLKVDLLAKIK